MDLFVDRDDIVADFWKTIFSKSLPDGSHFYSRDPLAKSFAVLNRLNMPEVFELLRRKWDVVFFNRIELGIFGFFEGLNHSKKIMIAHDITYLRKMNFQKQLNIVLPLTEIERSMEMTLLENMDSVWCINPKEALYLRDSFPTKQIERLAPQIRKPEKTELSNPNGVLNLYFLGVDNSVNENTVLEAIAVFEKLDPQKLGMQKKLHLIGGICSSEILEDYHNQNDIIFYVLFRNFILQYTTIMC